MDDFEETAARLERQIANVLERNPQSRSILQAFGPILRETARLKARMALSPVDEQAIDPMRLAGGVPAIRQTPLLLPEDPWDEIARSMIGAITQGFPTLLSELQSLKRGIDSGAIRLGDVHGTAEGAELPGRWAEELAIRRGVIDFLIWNVEKPVLEIRGRALAGLLTASGWDKGYCPCCGELPAVAVIHEKIPQRWLHCSRCGHDWRFSRVACPCCDHQSQREMPYFFVEGREQETAFICESCRRYLITVNHIGDLEKVELDVLAMGMTHLDLLMQERGYVPMTLCVWNVFD
jgi:FdhE protein